MHSQVRSLCFVLLVSGCSGSDPTITADDFKAQYPTAYCDHVFRCCSGDERSYGSKLICEQQVGSAVQELLGFTAAETPFATFLPVEAQKCLDNLRQGSCDDVSLVDVGCARTAVQPLHKEGEECTYSSECTTSYCVQPQKLVRGACGPTGGPNCSGDDRSCLEAYVCLGSKCELKRDTAQACGSPKECTSGICSTDTKSCLPRPSPYCDGK